MSEDKIKLGPKIKDEDFLSLDGAVNKELETMFKAGVHFGYSRSRRHPKMEPYIFGLRNNVEVFDLEKVKDKLQAAEEFLKDLASEKKMILFVGSKPPIADIVQRLVKEINMPYVNNRWLGGLLTNFKILRGRMDYFEDLKQKKLSGELVKYTKKEQHDFEKEIGKLENKFGGFVSLRSLPAAVVIVDPKEESTAVKEATQLNIPIVGILNSDSNPEKITYLIPANDAAPASVEYVLSALVRAYKEGSQKKSEEKKENKK